MQRKLRTIERIDYRKLHNTGIRQCKEMSSEEKKLAESNNDTQSVNGETYESNNDISKLDNKNVPLCTWRNSKKNLFGFWQMKLSAKNSSIFYFNRVTDG